MNIRFLGLLFSGVIACLTAVAQGTYQGASSVGGLRNDRIQAVATDSAGTTFAAGRISGTLRIQNTLLTGDDDLFVLAAEADGRLRWALRPSGIGRSEVYALAHDPAGYLYVAGVFRDTVRLANQTWISQRRSHDAFLWKIRTADGSLEWGRSFGSRYDDAALAVAFHPDGGLALGGWMGGPLMLSDTLTLPAADEREGWFALLDPADGSTLHGAALGGNEPDAGAGERVAAIAFADRGRQLIVAGHFDGIFNVGGLVSSQAYEGFVAAFHVPDGSLHWARAAGSTSEVSAVLADDSLGRVVVGGSFRDRLTWGGDALLSQGGADACWAVFDLATGALLYAHSTGSLGNDALRCLALDETGRLWAGGSRDAASFGGADAALWSLSRTDAALLAEHLAGGPEDDVLTALAPSGADLVAGGSFMVRTFGEARFGDTVLKGASEALEPTTDGWWAWWQGTAPDCRSFRLEHVFRMHRSGQRSAVAVARGGVEPYLWRAGAGTWQDKAQWNNLPAGTLRIEVLDGRGCRTDWTGEWE